MTFNLSTGAYHDILISSLLEDLTEIVKTQTPTTHQAFAELMGTLLVNEIAQHNGQISDRCKTIFSVVINLVVQDDNQAVHMAMLEAITGLLGSGKTPLLFKATSHLQNTFSGVYQCITTNESLGPPEGGWTYDRVARFNH